MSDFDRIRRFVAFRRSGVSIQRDIDDELRFHIEKRVEALRQIGLSAQEAREQALREFGDVEDARRYCVLMDQQRERRRRVSDWLSDLRYDAIHALRILARSPAFAFASVFTLALALGASTAVYAVLHTYLIRPLPFPDADRLFFVREPRVESGPSLENVDWGGVNSLFAASAVWNLDGFTIPGDAYAENVTGAWVTPGFFETLQLRPAHGRGFRPEEYRSEAPVAIISHDLWVKRFNSDPAVIGRTLTIRSTENPAAPSAVTIVGVTGPTFWPLHWRESDLFRPLAANPPGMPNLARLNAGTAAGKVEQRLNDIVRAQIRGTVDPAWKLSLVPALEQHSQGVRPILLALLGAALFMLLAACGSVAGALVSRHAARQGEFAVRLALGGSKARVGRQLITESAVLAGLAGALGLALAYVLLDVSGPLIERQLGTTVPGGAQALRPNSTILLLGAGASLIAGIALGALPAFTFLRAGGLPSGLLSVGRTTSARRGTARVRRVLIAGQVTVAIVLMFGAGLMFRTIARIVQTDVGFRTEGVVTGTLVLPENTYPDSSAKRIVIERLLAKLNNLEGVRSAAAVFPQPFWGYGGFPVTLDGTTDESQAPRATVFTVTPEYFRTIAITLQAGRSFNASDDHAAPRVVVVSEKLAARIAPNGSALGRRIRVRVPYLATWDDVDERPWRTIVGIVGDTRKSFAAAQPVVPDVYVPYAQNPRSWQSIVVQVSRSEQAMFEPVKRAVGSVDASIALSGVTSLNDMAADQIGQRSALLALLGVFAAFALVLSALALYASLSYTVVQRRSEIAVRRAVGADASSITRLVAAEGLTTAAIGLVTGSAASLALGRVLTNQLYGVSASDPVTLAASSFVLGLTALAACVLPCLRALRTDPVLALRE